MRKRGREEETYFDLEVRSAVGTSTGDYGGCPGHGGVGGGGGVISRGGGEEREGEEGAGVDYCALRRGAVGGRGLVCVCYYGVLNGPGDSMG